MDTTLMTFWMPFLGWASVINLGILLFSTLVIMLGKNAILSIHSRLFGLGEDSLMALYLGVLGMYKILIIVLCIVPWIVLRFFM